MIVTRVHRVYIFGTRILWARIETHTVADPPGVLWGKVATDGCCWLNENLVGSVAVASLANGDVDPGCGALKENWADCGEVELLFAVVDVIVSD